MKDEQVYSNSFTSVVKLSIITINLNNAIGLQQTLQSIFNQEEVSFETIESIVIDGGSTDSSKEIISSYSDKIAFHISEKDKGVYDAMNKAIKWTKGKYIWFLNSGDYLCGKRCLSAFIKAVDQSENYDLIYSDVYLYSKQKLTKRIQPQEITFAYLIKKMINHQSFVLKREYFLLEDNFRLDFKLISDWIFLFELFKERSISTYKIKYPLVVYDNAGMSISSGSLWLKERARYLESVYSKWELNCLYKLARLNSKQYFDDLINSLDSPRRSTLLTLFLKSLYVLKPFRA